MLKAPQIHASYRVRLIISCADITRILDELLRKIRNLKRVRFRLALANAVRAIRDCAVKILLKFKAIIEVQKRQRVAKKARAFLLKADTY